MELVTATATFVTAAAVTDIADEGEEGLGLVVVGVEVVVEEVVVVVVVEVEVGKVV